MKSFILLLFTLSFVSTGAYAYHHEEMDHDRNDENSFYDQYHGDRDNERRVQRHKRQRVHSKQGTRVVYKVRKGESSKKRRYENCKRDGHKKMMRHLKRRLNKLPIAKRDAALKEIERHHQEMQRIVGGQRGFPEFRGAKKARPAVASENLREVRAPKRVNEEVSSEVKAVPKRRPVKMRKPAQESSEDGSTVDKESNNIDSKRRIGRTRKMV